MKRDGIRATKFAAALLLELPNFPLSDGSDSKSRVPFTFRFVNGEPSMYLRFPRYLDTSLPLDFKTLFPGQTLQEKLESRLPLAADRLIILNLQRGDADQSFN